MNESAKFRILVIDDNPSIHRDFIKILTTNATSKLDQLSEGLFGESANTSNSLTEFEIDVASQGKEGVERIRSALQEEKRYSLAFVDIRMPPGWDGIETIKHIWEIDKNIQVVICTAYSDYSWEETISHLGKTDNLLILKKPFDNVAVRQLACALSMKWKLAEEVREYTSRLRQQLKNKTLSLQESLSLLKTAFESSNDGVLVLSLEGEIIEHNQKFVDMLEMPRSVLDLHSEDELIAHMRKILIYPEEFVATLKRLHAKTDDSISITLKLKNGKIIECYSEPHKLGDQIVGRIINFRDVTKRASLESELQFQSTHDALTGLPNRVKLLEQMRAEIKNSEQNKTCFALLFIDLDRFKLINDSLSHATGDKLLQSVARRLQAIVRAQDTVARLGGDEFVIVLKNIAKEKNIIEKISEVLSVFDQPFEMEERSIILTASIGVSLYPKDATTVDVLLRDADTAMYCAKASKGNHYEFYTPDMSVRNLAELDKESELRQAIVNNELFLCYQPQYDLKTEKLVAVEALIRWNHPARHILLPMDFIPLAEETGLIVPIGEWVIRTACGQNKAWQESGFTPIRIAVNVTAQQFKQMSFVETVKNILNETQLNPEYLELELTENVIISNREAIHVIGELKKLGLSIAVDDFGSGYSSLSYLHKIPLDRLKIDSSFIQHIQAGGEDDVIVRAVIEMAKGLHLDVIAEGIETETQVEFLKKYNCVDGQGYYFSKALTSTELEKIMSKPTKK